jgi:hypothetical protein
MKTKVIITTVAYSNNNVICLLYSKLFYLPFFGKCDVGVPAARLAVAAAKTKR